ncbi:hypothetical protein BH10CHL1_BH10CHL1_05490 [soil metagenome]
MATPLFYNAAATPDVQRAITFLNQNPLKNIVLLKMLQAYGALIQCYYVEQASSAGVLLLLPTQAFAFDRHTYPSTEYVVLLSTTGPTATELLLPLIPTACNLVFKLIDQYDRAVIEQRFTLNRVTAYLSYTAPPTHEFATANDVHVSTSLDQACLAIYVAQGHAATDVQQFFATQQAIAFTCYAEATPLATCFAYQNFADIWEIGGVYTVAQARRQGYAKRIVQTALHVLQAQHRTPRYQVHEQNTPSVALAEALGLYQFLTVEHFLYEV